MKSMTGYGKFSLEKEDYSLVWEIKSVNTRFLDINFKTPYFLTAEQPKWEKIIRKVAKRGRIEVYLSLVFKNPDLLNLSFDHAQARAMLQTLKSLAQSEGVNFVPEINTFLSLPHLWKNKEQEISPELQKDLTDSLEQTLILWDQSRQEEGQNLQQKITEYLKQMIGLLADIEEIIKENTQNHFCNLQNRVKELLKDLDTQPQQDRLLTELALLADRLDVSEEITRLKSHLQAIEKLEKEEEVGRKLDFYLQECFREINTCSNKVQNIEVSKRSVEIKGILEKIREQAQNLE